MRWSAEMRTIEYAIVLAILRVSMWAIPLASSMRDYTGNSIDKFCMQLHWKVPQALVADVLNAIMLAILRAFILV